MRRILTIAHRTLHRFARIARLRPCARCGFLLGAASMTLTLSGCSLWDHSEDPIQILPTAYDPAQPGPPAAVGTVPNPLQVQVTDREFVWNQIVDAVDDYFEIKSERRVQILGNVLMEGRVETHPLPGATMLEPWRHDSVPGFQLDHATLQSVRRTATVRVVPMGNNYAIEVVVQKDLEDVDRPAHSTPGAATPRHDGSLVREENISAVSSRTLGWLPQGRDTELEAEILTDIYRRLTSTGGPPNGV